MHQLEENLFNGYFIGADYETRLEFNTKYTMPEVGRGLIWKFLYLKLQSNWYWYQTKIIKTL